MNSTRKVFITQYLANIIPNPERCSLEYVLVQIVYHYIQPILGLPNYNRNVDLSYQLWQIKATKDIAIATLPYVCNVSININVVWLH